MSWMFRFRLWLAYKLIPTGYTIGSILYLNQAKEALIAAGRYIDKSGHLTNKYKAGKRLRSELTDVATALGQAEIGRKENDQTPQAS